MGFLEDFLMAPERAALRAQERPPVAAAFGAFVLAGLSLAVSKAVLSGGSIAFLAFAAAFAALMRVSAGTLMTALVHLLAEALGGRGRAAGLFALMGASDLGWTLALPAALLLRALAPGAWWAPLLCALPAAFAVLCLRARSVRGNYGLSPARAWAAVCLPYAAFAALAAAASMLLVAGLVQQFAGLIS
ncbi:MAG: hypothetical protein WCU88_02015 [Elusimicrobiota bacterium]|jgi:hypothetical protein